MVGGRVNWMDAPVSSLHWLLRNVVKMVNLSHLR